MKSAQKWIPKLAFTKPNDIVQDYELAQKAGTAAIWAFMHLQSLDLSIRRQKAVSQDILNQLLGGLRQSVMVYAYIRSALDLRNVPNSRYAEKLSADWDQEDQALASSA